MEIKSIFNDYINSILQEVYDWKDGILYKNGIPINIEEENEEEVELETVGISGEYWFDDSGTTMYADGDIGDMNHEAHVIQNCIGELASSFGIHDDEPYLETASPLEEAILSIIIDELDIEDEAEKENKINEIKNDPASAMINYLQETNNMSKDDANDLVLTAYGSMGDAREYAIKRWNWARVQGDAIECNKLDSGTLRNIASGINNALYEEGLWDEYSETPEVLEKHPYTISTYTGKRYEITLEDMEKGNISGLEQSDFDIKNSAATQQLRQQDISDMPAYYQKKGVIGDSYEYPKDQRERPPKGYKIKVRKVAGKGTWMEPNWYDCEVWGPESIELHYKDKPSRTMNVTKLLLSTSGTMFENKDKAWEVGVSRAWDIRDGKTEWS